MRGLARNIKTLSTVQDKNAQKFIMRKTRRLITEMLGDGFEASGCEASIETNFAALKFKHTVKKEKI